MRKLIVRDDHGGISCGLSCSPRLRTTARRHTGCNARESRLVLLDVTLCALNAHMCSWDLSRLTRERYSVRESRVFQVRQAMGNTRAPLPREQLPGPSPDHPALWRAVGA